MGRITALRSALDSAVDALSVAARISLADLLGANRADLRAMWGQDDSGFRHDFLDELEVIEFGIRESAKLADGKKTRPEELLFICLQCELTFIAIDIRNEAGCPSCGSWDRIVPKKV